MPRLTGKSLLPFVLVAQVGTPGLAANLDRLQVAIGAPDVRTLPLTSGVFRNTRDIRVYLPPGYDSAAARSVTYPILYLNDGFAVFAQRAWDAPRALDELIRAGTVPPMILIGIDNAASIDGAKTPLLDRASEYLPYPDAYEPDLPSPRGQDYPRFLFEEVMPLVERTFRVDRDRVSLGGSSYGGIAALYSAIVAPRRISGLLLESTPFFMFNERLTREAAAARWPAVVYVGIGTKETDDTQVLAKGALAMDHFVSAAKAAGARVVVNRVEGASHNSAAWKARFPAALVALSGRPPV